jgi:dynein heavy chain
VYVQYTNVGVWEYIESTRDKVRDLEQRVRLAKANVEQMHTLMNGWSQCPLFRRKEDKKDTLLNLEVSFHVQRNI